MEQGRADGCRKLLHCSRKITLWGDSLWVESGNRQDCSSSLPPSLGHGLGSSWVLALPEQRGQIQQLEHPCTPSSHLPATGNRAGGWKGPWIFNKNWLLRRVFQKEPLQILSKISNLQLFLSFFSKKAFPPYTSPGSFCIVCSSQWQQLQLWQGSCRNTFSMQTIDSDHQEAEVGTTAAGTSTASAVVPEGWWQGTSGLSSWICSMIGFSAAQRVMLRCAGYVSTLVPTAKCLSNFLWSSPPEGASDLQSCSWGHLC